MTTLISKTCFLAAFAGTLGSLSAQTLYWDTNGSTAGAGNPANGTWSTSDANWSTSSAGTVATEVYTAGRDVVFSAGTDAASATVTLSGNQSAASLTVEEGNVNIGGANVTGLTGSSALTVASGASATIDTVSFNTSGTFTTHGNLTVDVSGIRGGGALTKEGTGSISTTALDATATINAGLLSVSGGNKGKGATVNSGGTFRITGDGAMLDGTTVTVNSGGTFELSASVAETIGKLQGSGSTVLGAGAALTVGGGNGSATYSGTISGDGSLSKLGTGTATLGGTNTYKGNTTVDAGGLTLADNASMTFYIGATGVNNGIGGTGTLTLDGDFVFDLTGAASVGSWTIVDVGNLTETYGSTFTVQGFTEGTPGEWTSGNYTFTEATGILTAVPEPSVCLLVGVGLAGALWRTRRRKLG